MIRTVLLAGASVLAFSDATAGPATVFDYSGAVATYSVPVTGVYRITAAGAQGGDFAGHFGGRGAEAIGNLSLYAGATLYVAVGGQGVDSGGGGGSFVLTDLFAPLVIGGGGGGSVFGHNGGPGQNQTAGQTAAGGLPGVGGVAGGGGGAGSYAAAGGGGGGLLGAGASLGGFYATAGGAGAPTFAGGVSSNGENGGFGGGGGGYGGAGGGGGYSGGGGGSAQGGGGGSFVTSAASRATEIAGENSGDGFVSIALTSGVPEPTPWSVMLGGFGLLGYILRRRMAGGGRRASCSAGIARADSAPA